MIHYFYALPLWAMILIMLLGVLLWGLVARVCTAKSGFGRELWRYVNCALALIWLIFILYMTIFDRTADGREIILLPFYSFKEAQVQPEMYRSMLANVMLFVPLGAFMSNGWCAGCRNVILTSILVGLLLSLGVEAAQYVFALGRAEADDVITNTLGTAIGALSLWIGKGSLNNEH